MFKRKRRVEAEVEAAPPPPPPPAYDHGVTLLPEEGAAMRITSAADIDPNIKKQGLAGVPRGGAGGYGGAGT